MTAAETLTLHKLRKTPTRLAIVQNLLENNFPLSENEFHERMQDSYERITFYRTIHTLMEAGVIHRIVADNTTIRYALNQCSLLHHEHENSHVHFYCKHCGKVECLKEVAVQPYCLPNGYLKEECNVIIKGTCKQCASQKSD